MKTNEELQKDVQNAIKWEPLLHAAEIGVTAKDGIVTLTGSVDSFDKKLQAENAAKNVGGVKAVVEEIKVHFPDGFSKTDAEIAADALRVLNHNPSVPKERVKVTVENGYVTLNGELPWNYQKEAAKKALRHLNGLKGVHNAITIKSETRESIEKRFVENALERNWSIDADKIKVAVSGTKVTLTGNVSSVYQKEEAGRIAWNTPGVWFVENDLVVDYQHSYAE